MLIYRVLEAIWGCDVSPRAVASLFVAPEEAAVVVAMQFAKSQDRVKKKQEKGVPDPPHVLPDSITVACAKIWPCLQPTVLPLLSL